MLNFKRTMILLTLILTAVPADAAPQRKRLEATDYPWSAVGRVNVAGRRWCSGVLVSERHILTAAHCLWNPAAGDWWPAGSIHFIAGYQGGEAAMHSLVKEFKVADRFDPAHPAQSIGSAGDWVIAELEEPLGRKAGWIGAAKASVVHPPMVGQIGYRAEAPHAMSLDYGCSLRGIAQALLWDDCEAAHGDSGGPLLAFDADGPHLLGIVILAANAGKTPLSGAVPIASIIDTARFPTAAALSIAAGIGATPGQKPEAGSPVDLGALTQSLLRSAGP